MVYNYKRKTMQQSWKVENMEAALAAYRNGMSINAAARQHNIPITTLFRRIKNKTDAERVEKKLGRYRCVFNLDQEKMLVDYVLQMEERLFGLTIADLKSLAYQFAVRNLISHTFNKEKQVAGKDWVYGFLKRHPELSLRLPEKTSAARASAFNEVNVNKFFDLLDNLYETHRYPPNRIYNCDETGITTVPNKPSKVISKKGKKQVGVLSSAERGTLVTAEICFNAAGEYIPPALVFPRVRHSATFENGVPPNTKIFTHPTGWMQTNIFTEWFEHFLKFAKPTAEERVLLILDGHATHIKNLNLLTIAKQKFVDILVLPPHCTHRLQPLDVSFMYPISTYYQQTVRVWLREHPGKIVTIHDVGGLFGEAYLKAATMETAISGFRKTGIFPFQRIFNSSNFAAAETTNRVMAIAGRSQDQEPCASQEPQTPQTFPGGIVVSPQDILPFPHVGYSGQGNDVQKRTKRHGSTVVATSTPFIEELKKSKTPKEPPKKRTKVVTKHLFSESDSDSESDETGPPLDDESFEEEERSLNCSNVKCMIDDLNEGSWIAVKYEGNLFPGLVMRCGNKEVLVKCMEKRQKYFRWPDKEDVLTYTEDDIYMAIKEPKALKRGFFDVPELTTYVTP